MASYCFGNSMANIRKEVNVNLYIADTPCMLTYNKGVPELYALDEGGPRGGPRRLSLSLDLLKEIERYVKEVTESDTGGAALECNSGVRDELPGLQLDVVPQEAAGEGPGLRGDLSAGGLPGGGDLQPPG